MATKKATPSGLTITRNNNVFTFKWKRHNSPTAQQLQYRLLVGGKWKAWTSLSVTASATSKGLTLNWANYYPSSSTLTGVDFRVRGKKGGKWSSWVKVAKTFPLSAPKKPSLSEQLSNDYSNVTEFTWSFSPETSGERAFTNLQWESVLQDGYNEAGIKATSNWNTLTGYQSGTSTTTSYTQSITEQSANIASGSHTRWFRIRARGAAGASDWVYSKHIYAKPNQATITSNNATPTTSGSLATVDWNTDNGSGAFPVDSITARYSIAIPNTGLTFPSGGTWTDADISADALGNGGAVFDVPVTLDPDECLFVQINTTHDRTTTNGTPTIARLGVLAAPTNLSVQTNNTTYKATITVTNNSAVPDSFMAIRYCPTSNPNGIVVGIIAHGSNSATVQCPDWSAETAIRFEVYAVQGSYTTTSLGGGVTEYRINANMTSSSLNDGGTIPVAPATISAEATDAPGTIQVKWAWSWADADGAEISWADHEDAWESTDAPSTFEVTNLHASKWNISGLETGIKWYVRVRLFKTGTDSKTYGAYSKMETVDLSSAPSTPIMMLSSGIIPADGMTTATWAYVSTDGTTQSYAEICEATYVSNVLTYGDVIASTKTAQHIDLYAEKISGWTAGTVHYLCLRVQSGSGLLSDKWSAPVPVTIAEPITCSITATSLTNVTISTTDQNGTTVSYTAPGLTQLPLTVTVSGAGASDTVTVAIERKGNYFLERPDESQFTGYAGETIAIVSMSGNGTATINKGDLLGMLDDGAEYTIVATINDELGQGDTATQDFVVAWSHQALIPTATIALNNEVMEITPVQPTGAVAGDLCDIYRLSIDKPQLIVEGASWSTKYVDPYPTIGDFGGYRIVFKSLYGDYITSAGDLAWTDYGKDDGVYYYTPETIISFGSQEVRVKLDMTLTGEWTKDFKETQYLGGSVKGDWNPAVSRSGTVSATTIRYLDAETIALLHDLADYSGVCKVRMPDGTNISADVEVTLNNDFGNSPKTTECTLSITRVDGEGLDGLTYAEWSA